MVAAIYLAAFKDALPTVRLAHTDDEVRRWIARLCASGAVWVGERDGRLAGMMSVAGGSVDALYVAPPDQGAGVGSRLVEHAKAKSNGVLRLYTFQVNQRARDFYESKGFRAIGFGDGSGNEERAPDVLYEWRRS